MVDDSAPLYEQVKQELREAIARHEYVHDEPFITQRELCARYRVSTTTAARALNELVLEGVLVRRRGQGTFVAESAPRPSAPTAERTVAYIGPYGWHHDGNGPHHTGIVGGVDAVCGELGFRLFITTSVDSPQSERRALQRALDTGADGVVLYPMEGHSNTDLLAELRDRHVPIVMVDRYRPGLSDDVVTADNYAVGRELTDHLIADGHRRIATLWSETDTTSVRDRLVGHLRSLQEHDVAVSPQLTSLRNYFELCEAERTALLGDLFATGQPPTALLCANGGVLSTAVHDLLRVAPEVADRLVLAGMDDQAPYSSLVPVTKVAAVLPSKEIGEQAMRLLADRLNSPGAAIPPRHVVLPVRIRSNDTVTPLTHLLDARPA